MLHIEWLILHLSVVYCVRLLQYLRSFKFSFASACSKLSKRLHPQMDLLSSDKEIIDAQRGNETVFIVSSVLYIIVIFACSSLLFFLDHTQTSIWLVTGLCLLSILSTAIIAAIFYKFK